MFSKLHLIFLGIYILIIIVNNKPLKNPKPYPPEEIRKEIRSGGGSLASYKYVGFSHYLLQDLLKAKQIGKMEMLIGTGLV